MQYPTPSSVSLYIPSVVPSLANICTLFHHLIQAICSLSTSACSLLNGMGVFHVHYMHAVCICPLLRLYHTAVVWYAYVIVVNIIHFLSFYRVKCEKCALKASLMATLTSSDQL